MCGIAGITFPDEALVTAMNERQAHRGPDDTGLFGDAHVTLGHKRLAIQDLSPRGHQPMASPDEKLWITFVGEIYNFKELRAELERVGERFTSGSDTEVIVRGYAREGAIFFGKMRGMWALGIYDIPAQKLVLARDPFGIKPLYYYLHEGRLAFSSELRALSPVLSRFGHSDDALAHRLYFLFGYIPAPLSPFTQVRKALPGEVLVFDLKAKTLSSVAVVPPYENDPPPQSLEEALDDSIRAHFVSDVPVCLFFSGGIDSTLLLAKSRELGFAPEPFFLQIPNRLDNDYAFAAAKELGVALTTFLFGEEEALQMLERARTRLDEPFADTAYIPTEYLSSQVAKTHKVVLSGEGGDEFFGGYYRHNHLLPLRGGARLVPAALVRRLPTRARRAVESKLNRDPFAAYIEFVRLDEGLGDRAEALRFLRERVGAHRHDALALALDQALYLPDDLLFKIDRAGMQHGLEGRVPFLDKRFFAAARAMPAEKRHGGGAAGKKALKDILRRYLPEHLVERPKQGFSFPLRMLDALPPDLLRAALEEARAHPELVPLNLRTLADHPPVAYALLMWAGWRENFFH